MYDYIVRRGYLLHHPAQGCVFPLSKDKLSLVNPRVVYNEARCLGPGSLLCVQVLICI